MSFLDFVLAMLLAGHLWCAGTAVFAPAFSALCEVAESRGWRDLGVLGRYQARLGIVTLVLSAVIGLIYGAMIWDRSLNQALGRLQSRLVFGTIEWLFSLTLIVICLIWWHRRPKARRVERGLRIATLLLAATNLAYHFPVFFEVLSSLRTQTNSDSEPLTSSEFRQRLLRPRVFSQVVHFWLASLIAGGSLLILAMNMTADGWTRPLGNLVQRMVGGLLLVSTTLQLIVGIWVTANVPAGKQFQITQPGPLSTIFAIGVVVALALIPHGASLLFGRRTKQPPMHVVFHVGLVFCLMALITRLLKA